MATITVYPTKESALNVVHPTSGKLKLAGSAWQMDGFTSRMVSDGIVTLDPDKAWRAPAPEPAPLTPAQKQAPGKPAGMS
jgi:hypothetical protein